MTGIVDNKTKITISSELGESDVEAIGKFLSAFDDSFFYSLDWLTAAAETLYPAGSVDYIVGRKESDELTGFCSFVRTRTTFLKLFHPQVLALTGTRSVISPEHLDLPIGRQQLAEWSLFFSRYFERNLRNCDFAVFDSIRENSKGMEIITDQAGLAGFGIIKQKQDVCPYFELPDGFESLLNSYSTNMRKITRRTLKRAGDRFRLVDYSEIGDFETAFTSARKLHELSRNQKGDKSSFNRSGYLEFHLALAKKLAGQGKLYFKFLLAGKKPVAFRYGFLDGDVYYDYQTGFDPEYSTDRPGFLIVALSVKELIDLKVKRFDFLRGDEPYKEHWAIGRRQSYRYYLFGRSLKSRLFYNLFRVYLRLKNES